MSDEEKEGIDIGDIIIIGVIGLIIIGIIYAIFVYDNYLERSTYNVMCLNNPEELYKEPCTTKKDCLNICTTRQQQEQEKK